VISSGTRPSTPPPHGGGNESSEVSHAPRASPGTQSQRVALFDLDLTLLDVNTGRLWVEKEFREGKVPFGLYLLAVYWFAKYAAGLGIDAGEVAREAMGHYKGISDAAMTQEVEAFWNLECAHRLRPGAAAALAAHRAAGDRCVLCTASWQHIAAAARRSFALDGAICSFIEVGAEGTFTGAVVDAYGDGKWRRTLEWAQAEGVDLANCTFYTDSYSDMRLMQAVGTPVAVCPDSRLADAARKSGWRIEDWGHAPMQANATKQRYQCSILGITNGCM
jgi:HAD superfamily hydrolase (TIGR01490 family)